MGGSKQPPIWIVKPEDGTQGAGIFMVHTFDFLMEKMQSKTGRRNYVIQDYVANPLLVDGLKFDFRMPVAARRWLWLGLSLTGSSSGVCCGAPRRRMPLGAAGSPGVNVAGAAGAGTPRSSASTRSRFT